MSPGAFALCTFQAPLHVCQPTQEFRFRLQLLPWAAVASHYVVLARCRLWWTDAT